jgi:hypothetical protein
MRDAVDLTVPGRGSYTGVMASPLTGSMDFENSNTARDMTQPMYIAESAKCIPGQVRLGCQVNYEHSRE